MISPDPLAILAVFSVVAILGLILADREYQRQLDEEDVEEPHHFRRIR